MILAREKESTEDFAFYKAFEDRFRGSRQHISERLRIYIPYIRLLKEVSKKSKPVGIDIGCGRCEWLDILKAEGFATIGIDINPDMTAENEGEHIIMSGEAISKLSEIANCSASVISAFHLLEHIPFTQTVRLLTHAMRILEPGGILILETPNIECLAVHTSFHLDPTHIRPLPSDLLSFACEFYGFRRHVCLRPLDDPTLRLQRKPVVQDILYALSGDLGLIAQKEEDAEQLIDPWEKLFDPPGALNNGLILSGIEQRIYDLERSSLTLRIFKMLGKAKASIRNFIASMGRRRPRARNKFHNMVSKDCRPT